MRPRGVVSIAMKGLLSLAMIVVAAAETHAQKPVMLQLRPRIGDTIWMRLDQTTELASKRADLKAPAALTTTTVTWSRAVIESGVAAATTIVAITDSVFISSGDQAAKGMSPTGQRQMQGQRVRLEIAPDGSLTMAPDNASPSKAVARPASLIPATFPSKPVAVGDKWVREAPLPAGTSQLGASVLGWVQATFHFDSLTHNGDLAWVSVKGKLLPDPSGLKKDGVATVDDGSVEGYMVLDRARGWLTESRFSIIAHSSLRQPFGVTGQPMSFEIRLVQALKTLK
jgi:hypothetical protein